MMAQKESLKRLISVEGGNHGFLSEKILTLTNEVLEHILAISTIREKYNSIPPTVDPFQFVEESLKTLRIGHCLRLRDIQEIPPAGPVIAVANHPFGGIDGLILAQVLSAVRKDIKILANHFLNGFHELAGLFLPVDPFGGNDSTPKNIASLKKAVGWLKQGGMLVCFPAGEVSHFSWKNLRVEDPAWNPTVARLALMTRAPVLPVYFEGRNSILFQTLGLIHPRLRTAMLPRETLKKRNVQVRLKIGSLISHKKIRDFGQPEDLSEYLRFRTYLLALAMKKDQKLIRLPPLDKVRRRKIMDVALPQDFNALAEEVGNLSAHQRLVDQREFSVYYARAGQIPRVLAEIGRLREKTFRAAGEGTGKAIDLDRFDNIYIHLFLWHKKKMEVAGAYRLAPTDEILTRYGKKGLYTQTLFRYRKEFLEKMGPALEMGRTFVRIEYQKEYLALLLLWKGIGRFVSKNPRYRILFGAVSISNDYSSHSRNLMVSFLRLNNFFQELSQMVKPRRHFRNKKIIALNPERVKFRGDDLEELSAWVSCVEEDGKGVPILLKQYLRLGGKFLSFNVDPDFGDVVDGLILVNLTETDDRTLRRYMTDDGYERFMASHSAADPAPCLTQQG